MTGTGALLLQFLLAQAAAPPTASAPAAPVGPVEPVGSFHNFRFDDEQQSGFGLDLWRSPQGYVGVFIVAEGPQTPCGPLEVVSAESAEGDLSFTAVMSTGTHRCAIHAGVPSRDAFLFRGRLRGDSIQGTVARQDRLHPEASANETSLRLKKDKGTTLPNYPSVADWERAEMARCPPPPP